MSLVSVIMPTYNSAKFVTETIDNLIQQTYPHIELIVVDDGSRDDTVPVVRNKLIRDFKHPWQIIELGSNRGPSAARNVGLRSATGSWVQYLDSDDFMSPSKLELQMAYCERESSDVSAVYSPWRQCYVDSGKITLAGHLTQPDMVGRAPIMCLVSNHRPLHSAGLARRAVLEQIGGFDETLRFWECEEVSFRLAKAGRFVKVPSAKPLYLWRQHRDRVYLGGDDARYQSTPVALSWIEQILKGLEYKTLDEVDLSEADRRDILYYSADWARTLYSQDRTAFRKYVATARRLDPNLAPAYPKIISALSRHIGYEGAEAIANLSGAPAAALRKVARGLKSRPQESAFDWN
jgi:glycosyltransferase involved in cell wall biosynthesis